MLMATFNRLGRDGDNDALLRHEFTACRVVLISTKLIGAGKTRIGLL